MMDARDYSIEIRNEADYYIGRDVRDRQYAHMTSSVAADDATEGRIELRIGRGNAVALTVAEAKDVAETLLAAADGAMPKPDRVVGVMVDDYGRSLNVTYRILQNGGDRIHFARALQDAGEMKRLQAALMKAYPLEAE